MKQECEIVRDLMPLVLDDVASDGSKHMVSAHVQTCAECAAYMNQLKADLPAGQKGAVDSHAAFDAAAQTLRKQKRPPHPPQYPAGCVDCVHPWAGKSILLRLADERNAPDSDERIRDSAVQAGGRQTCRFGSTITKA